MLLLSIETKRDTCMITSKENMKKKKKQINIIFGQIPHVHSFRNQFSLST
jgi:hypothetical protein